MAGHSPHGECGLKSRAVNKVISSSLSLPAWGVWIEISNSALLLLNCFIVTPRMGSVD